ncbi:amidohydrolase family protein [Amycolatopsis pithecellobii]|uniref:Amidohydrolase family protein n=1 Tax=Amycolatopsis pithecellobii TaxID=664692 RepID=A0A6N7YWB9_9PSEU|nr:amidohydrolase family protein [Amycolatopsis pithecellobii]MTD52629.1 amidohydrolase family protein [Amycolatopsis pithecellobii]
MSARIDVHQHVVPPQWAQALAERNLDSGGWPIPDWSAESAIAMMDRQHIATGVLSVTAPGVHLGDDREARALARSVNEFNAERVKDRPDRFGSFASVPLPDVDGATAEAVYALDELHADGIVLVSNANGQYLGDAALDPLWTELQRRHAVVFIHPAQPPMPLLPGTPAPWVDFVFDTTRSALNMVSAGVMDRYPDLKVILAHAGGFLPYAAYRFAGLTLTTNDQNRTPDDVLRQLKWFYFDTALSASPSALPALLAFAEPGHVLYGSDWPFAPEPVGSYYNGFLESYQDFAPGQPEAIDRGNAEILFPRLKTR